MSKLIQDLRKIPKVILGFGLVSLGLLFSEKSDLGMLPWGVLHTGIANLTGLKFGNVVQLVGIIVLIFSVIFVKVKPGIGTFLDIVFTGMIYNLIDSLHLINESHNQYVSIIYMVLGVIVTAFGTALYVSCKLGAGPRDGLFIGFSRITNLNVKYTKPVVEIIVLIIGIFLHGDFGVGTFINAFLSGYMINLCFILLKYDPKKNLPSQFGDYFPKKSVLLES